jgi:hypothetical protein
MSEAEELLPCPFCGGEPKMRWCGGVYLVECGVCWVSKGDDGGENFKAEAIANWNRRARPAAADGVVVPENCTSDERGIRTVGPHGGLKESMPSPMGTDLIDPLFEAIWQTTKTWDVNAPEYYVGYCGMNGSHVLLILKAIRKAMLSAAPSADRKGGRGMSESHSCGYYCDRPECIKAQRDELRDKVEALRKDAERYRWLRSRKPDDYCICCGYDGLELFVGETLDNAIDAVIEGEK